MVQQSKVFVAVVALIDLDGLLHRGVIALFQSHDHLWEAAS
jgi:hypothetical protein